MKNWADVVDEDAGWFYLVEAGLVTMKMKDGGSPAFPCRHYDVQCATASAALTAGLLVNGSTLAAKYKYLKLRTANRRKHDRLWNGLAHGISCIC